MGAYSTLCPLDVARLRDEVAPAVRALLAGLGVHLEIECVQLDRDLGLRARPPADMLAVVPALRGACDVATCPVADRCPMHRQQTGPTRFERFGALVKESVLRCCPGDPPSVLLGRHGTLHQLLTWYRNELGDDSYTTDAHRAQLLASPDPLIGLFVRLGRRAAAWGWGDGGHGEGVLGWLDAAEAAALADALAAYDLAPTAPAPPTLDDHTRSEDLPRARKMLADIRAMAGRCADRDLGVLLRRD